MTIMRIIFFSLLFSLGYAKVVNKSCSGIFAPKGNSKGCLQSPNYAGKGEKGIVANCEWNFTNPDKDYFLEFEIINLFLAYNEKDSNAPTCPGSYILSFQDEPLDCQMNANELPREDHFMVFYDPAFCRLEEAACNKISNTTSFPLLVTYQSDGRRNFTEDIQGFEVEYEYKKCLAVTTRAGATGVGTTRAGTTGATTIQSTSAKVHDRSTTLQHSSAGISRGKSPAPITAGISIGVVVAIVVLIVIIVLVAKRRQRSMKNKDSGSNPQAPGNEMSRITGADLDEFQYSTIPDLGRSEQSAEDRCKNSSSQGDRIHVEHVQYEICSIPGNLPEDGAHNSDNSANKITVNNVLYEASKVPEGTTEGDSTHTAGSDNKVTVANVLYEDSSAMTDKSPEGDKMLSAEDSNKITVDNVLYKAYSEA